MKKIFLSLTLFALAAAPMAAQAAQCRDAKGRFTSCGHAAAAPAKPAAAKPAAAAHPVAHATPAPHPATVTAAKAAPKRCRVNGKFASCSAPGAKPV